MGFLVACNLPAELLLTATPKPEPTVKNTTEWQPIASGLDWRALNPDGDNIAQIIVLRIDPAQYRFRAIYHPGEPKNLSQWRELEPAASIIINANFFDRAGGALGLVVSDAVSYGSPYRDRGGTFLVENGSPSIQTHRSQPPLSPQNLEQAVQGFPLLMENGEPAYFSTNRGERNRRTMIAEDRQGNILIMVSPFLGLSLADLSAYLPTTDLDIQTAFNLDGGGSTMLALPAMDYFQPAFDAVPAILTVYPR